MNFNEIIFDLDGPLLEGSNRHYQCYADFILQKGLEPLAVQDYWQQKRQGIDRKTLLAQSGAEVFYDEFWQFWLEHIEKTQYLQLNDLQPEVLDILSVLQQANIKLYLVTMRRNAAGLQQELIDKKISLYFDKIVAVGIDTPIDSKANAAASVVFNKNKALWVGDTEVDILAAKSLGIKVCALSNGLRTSNFLEKFMPDYLMNNLKDFFDMLMREKNIESF
jgi:phosphoglycolate phosphatase